MTVFNTSLFTFYWSSFKSVVSIFPVWTANNADNMILDVSDFVMGRLAPLCFSVRCLIAF